jgi:diguanylate cyclase (GGDEF)-like protein
MLDRSNKHQRRAINFTPTVFVMLDIDYFKAINDSKGHLFGDEVLLLLAQQMVDSFRENDLLFRYGGEEFAMVLMDVEPEQAQQTLDRFREKVASYAFPSVGRVTISVGYTLFDKRLTVDELIGQADTALYYCKNTTRNAVHSYQELVAKGLTRGLKIPKARHIETS